MYVQAIAVDINYGTYMPYNAAFAIENGRLQEGDVERALQNLMTVLFLLGFFDGDPLKGPFGRLGSQDVCTKEHQGLALKAVRQGIVLLKNDKKLLPLNKNGVPSLAIIGSGAKSQLLGGYSGLTHAEIIYGSEHCIAFGSFLHRGAIYHFGHGLSYTYYTYKLLSALNRLSLLRFMKSGAGKRELYQTEAGVEYIPTNELLSCEMLSFSVQMSVMNMDHMDGSHVVMVYSRASRAVDGARKRNLLDSARYILEHLSD
ncbi:hypothetical protein Cgig2_032061 [Carnegiea gigantea]|uniref:Glycoside hydrolase family 3 C-terminal domain-containing protein n=1 Tax=Carnegiea gigantea TaxID=171969 RepID=A0A9Q1JZ88_9CARY|nr:hypothetical protein Cgig2_032061 [Carnegiea gigantea]